jgi:hypothetical protein
MPWRHMVEWMYRSTFLDPGISWRWVVTFTPQPLYPQGKSPHHPLDRRLGGPRACLDDMEMRTFFTLLGLQLQLLGHLACSQSLYQLRYPSSKTNNVVPCYIRNQTFNSWQVQTIFLCSIVYRPAMSTKFSVQWVLWALSMGMTWLENEADDSPPTNAKYTTMELDTHISS